MTTYRVVKIKKQQYRLFAIKDLKYMSENNFQAPNKNMPLIRQLTDTLSKHFTNIIPGIKNDHISNKRSANKFSLNEHASYLNSSNYGA